MPREAGSAGFCLADFAHHASFQALCQQLVVPAFLSAGSGRDYGVKGVVLKTGARKEGARSGVSWFPIKERRVLSTDGRS